MSMFNMGSVKGTQVAKPTNYLKAGIHTVIFKGIDKVEGTESLELRFEAVDGGGVHNERIFSPRSDERTMGQYGLNPSEADQFMCKIKQIIDALDSKLSKKIDEQGESFSAPDFTAFVALLKKYLDPKVGATVQIKLLPTTGSFVGFPGFPGRINKDGDLYMTTKFIGEDLTLTPRESTLLSTVKQAKPTTMVADELADLKDDISGESEDDNLPF